MTQICPSCEGKLSGRGFYCPTCGTQALCKACGATLELQARFCVSCGTALGGDVAPDLGNASEGNEKSAHNVIEFEEDTKRRSFRASVTDRAVDSVGKSLALFLARSPVTLGKRSRKFFMNSTVDTEDSQPALPGIVLDTSEEAKEERADVGGTEIEQTLTGDPSEQLKKIFRSTADNELKLVDSRLKQDSQRDFVRRLSVLFLYMNELKGRDNILRSDLNAILSDSRVYDSNARAWILKADLLVIDGDSISLSVPGREFAERALEEIRDPQIETKWSLNSRGVRPKRSNQKRGTPSKPSLSRADEAKSVDWPHDPDSWGMPPQKWNTAKKAQWLLYVVSRQTDVREMTSSQIAVTFNKHFREAGTIRPQNVARDFGKLKTKSPAPVSQDTTKDSGSWFLTQSGEAEAAELANQALGRSPDTKKDS